MLETEAGGIIDDLGGGIAVPGEATRGIGILTPLDGDVGGGIEDRGVVVGSGILDADGGGSGVVDTDGGGIVDRVPSPTPPLETVGEVGGGMLRLLDPIVGCGNGIDGDRGATEGGGMTEGAGMRLPVAIR